MASPEPVLCPPHARSYRGQGAARKTHRRPPQWLWRGRYRLSLAARRSAVLIRVCHPGPVARKCATTSALSRKGVSRLGVAAKCVKRKSIQPRADDPTQNLERRVDQAVDHLVADALAVTVL